MEQEVTTFCRLETFDYGEGGMLDIVIVPSSRMYMVRWTIVDGPDQFKEYGIGKTDDEFPFDLQQEINSTPSKFFHGTINSKVGSCIDGLIDEICMPDHNDPNTFSLLN